MTTRPSSADLLAGLSIAGLLLPEAVAYSGVANLPPQAGVIALLAPGQAPSGALLAAAVNLHLLVLTTALLAGAAAWLAGGAGRGAAKGANIPANAKL